MAVHPGARVVSAERGESAWRLVTADGEVFAAAAVVLSAGCWSGRLDWVPPESRPPVRPVKGQILTLRGSAKEPVSERIVAGDRVYTVPRADGRLIIGATVEERGFDTTVTAEGTVAVTLASDGVIDDTARIPALAAHP